MLWMECHAGEGGGLYLPISTLVVNNSTIVGNQAATAAGIYTYISLSTVIRNTILANNKVVALSECSFSSDWARYMDHDLVEHIGSFCADLPVGNIVGDPKLLPTQIGMPPYYALAPDSPAIDAGNSATCLTTDERGLSPPGSACDIGAFEYGGIGTLAANIVPYQGATQYVLAGTPVRVNLSAIVLAASGEPVPGVQ